MTKIKGWKKIDDDGNLLIYESIQGNRIGTFQRTFQNWYNIYYNGNELNLKKMNKNQAKAYVIKYMRANPNG
jgi:hypothetical protein